VLGPAASGLQAKFHAPVLLLAAHCFGFACTKCTHQIQSASRKKHRRSFQETAVFLSRGDALVRGSKGQ
jgi:hypothetical protein